MTPGFIATAVIICWISGLIGLLFVGGWLVRHDVAGAAAGNSATPYAASRIIGDLRPLQHTVAEFIAADGPSRRLLKFLSSAQATRLRDQVARAPERTVAGLMILAVAGLVRLGRGGFRLTGSGREMAKRIRRWST